MFFAELPAQRLYYSLRIRLIVDLLKGGPFKKVFLSREHRKKKRKIKLEGEVEKKLNRLKKKSSFCVPSMIYRTVFIWPAINRDLPTEELEKNARANPLRGAAYVYYIWVYAFLFYFFICIYVFIFSELCAHIFNAYHLLL